MVLCWCPVTMLLLQYWDTPTVVRLIIIRSPIIYYTLKNSHLVINQVAVCIREIFPK